MASLLKPGKMHPERTTFSRVVRNERGSEKVDGRKNNRGSDRRQRYTNELKAKVLDEWFQNPDISQDTFASLYRITQPNLNRWLSNKDNIYQEGAKETTRRLMSTTTLQVRTKCVL